MKAIIVYEDEMTQSGQEPDLAKMAFYREKGFSFVPPSECYLHPGCARAEVEGAEGIKALLKEAIEFLITDPHIQISFHEHKLSKIKFPCLDIEIKGQDKEGHPGTFTFHIWAQENEKIFHLLETIPD